MNYDAFISYNRLKDMQLATNLQSAMSRFARPWYRSRAMRVYRDDTNLAAASGLWPAIYDALDHSAYFILVASPEAARSDGVSREIQHWLKGHTRQTILIALAGGSVHWDHSTNDFDWDKSDAIPRCLKKVFDREPKYADLRGVKWGKHSWLRNASNEIAVADLVATIRGVEKDTLVGEHIRQQRKTKRFILGTCAVLALTAIIAIFSAVMAVKQRKIAEQKGQMDLARYLGVQSEQLISEDSGTGLLRGALLAVESARRLKTLSGHSALTKALKLLPLPIHKLSHDFGVYGIAANKNGSLLLTASGNYYGHYLRLWDLSTGRERFTLKSQAAIEDMAILHNDRLVAAVTARHSPSLRGLGLNIGIWDVSHRLLTARIEDKQALFPALIGAGGRLLAARRNKRYIRLWDLSAQKQLTELVHPAPIEGFAFSVDGKRLATCSRDGTALIWDLESSKPPLRLMHSGPLEAVAFSADGAMLASGGIDRTAHVWDAAKGSEIAKFEHPSEVMAVALDKDGHRLATLDKVDVMRIWDVQSRSQLASLPQAQKPNGLTFSPSGEKLATAGKDNTARIWTVDTGKELFRIAHNDEVKRAIFLPIEDRLVTASDDSLARVWKLEGWRQVVMYAVHDDEVVDVAFNAGGEQLISASKDHTARIWDMKTGRETARLVHNASVLSVAFSPSCDRAATGSMDGAAHVWDVSTAQKLLSLAQKAKINSVAFSPSGDQLATGGDLVWNLSNDVDDPGLKLWRLDSGDRVADFPHASEVFKVIFARSGDRLISTDGRAIRVWDVSSAKTITTMKPEKRAYGGIKQLAMNQAGDRLATANFDGTVSVWDLSNSKEHARLAHGGHVNAVAFGFTNNVLAAGGKDGIVRIWDLTTGNEIARLDHDQEVTALAFSPTSDLLATASGKNLRVWVWRFEDLMDDICSRLPRNFTFQEWRLYLGNEPYHPTCPHLPGDTFGEKVSRVVSETQKFFQYGIHTKNPNQNNWPKY